NMNVLPTLRDNCSSCHAGVGPTSGPTYLGKDTSTYYGQLVADPRFVNNQPSRSLLVTKGPHTGPALTAAQGTAVEGWLTQENFERHNLPNPPPAANLAQQALDKFS